MDEFELTEKDIEVILNYLKIFEPERANPKGLLEKIEEMRCLSKVVADFEIN